MTQKTRVDFRPGVTTEVEVEEGRLLFVAEPRGFFSVPDQETIIERALNHPIGTGRLEDMLRRDHTVAVLVDDITRPTPTAKILPAVLRRIERAGIPDRHVLIIMAMGTHRPMTEQELEIKLGRAVMDRYQVINRDYRQTDKFVPCGQTESGIPIEIDREVVEADFVIGLGNITPHISAGWSGGAKIILPGVCSQKTTDRMHLMACVMQPVLEVIGTVDNKPRREMEAIASRVGLSYIVNTVLDDRHRMLGVFAGHFKDAHEDGARMAEEQMVVPIPRQADILIVSAHPCHFDYWQGVKPYAYCHRAVRKGGVIIFMLDGAEGLCGDAPSHDRTVRKYLLHSFSDLVAAVDRGEVEDIVGLNVPMYHATLRHRTTNFLVTNHMKQRDVEAMGFTQMPNVQAALEEAQGMLGDKGAVGIIPYGGETLVRMQDGSEPWREEFKTGWP